MTSNFLAVGSMSELPSTERVYSAGREDLAAYMHLVSTSTASQHGQAIEAVIQVACQKYQRMHDAYVHFLAGRDRTGSGQPGSERRSTRWRETAEAWASVQEALAAAMGVLYPKPDRGLPLIEVQMLVKNRLGPLCFGWTNFQGRLIHHPDQPCEAHPDIKDR